MSAYRYSTTNFSGSLDRDLAARDAAMARDEAERHYLITDALESLPEGLVTVPDGWSLPKKATMLDRYRDWLASYVEGVAPDTKEERRKWAEAWAEEEMSRG